MSLGKRIVELRVAMGFNQSELAKRAGTTSATISRYESDQIESPRIPLLLAISAVLEVNPQYLINGTGSKSIQSVNPDTEKMMAAYEQLSHDAKAMIFAAAISLIK